MSEILIERAARLKLLLTSPKYNVECIVKYRDNPVSFINDWGMTFDPRLVEKGQSPYMPFTLFPKQAEWVEWFYDNWRSGRGGITEKSRDCGITWLAIASACHICCFHNGASIGFGSRKEEYLDGTHSPNAILWRARFFLSRLPKVFTGEWSHRHLNIAFHRQESYMRGEAGDNIGRGDRTSVYFVDEAAHIERPQLIDNSLVSNTNCVQYISSPAGMGNPFAEKRHSGTWPVFTFHWRDDPRKSQEWYDSQCRLYDPVIIAQEIDISYTGSVDGVVLPSGWLQSCVDAHKRLGIIPSGMKRGALDIADEGPDKSAFACGQGIQLWFVTDWIGSGSNIHTSTAKAFDYCEEAGITNLIYDADGMGAAVRSSGDVLNETRSEERRIRLHPHRGSGKIIRPDSMDFPGRKNGDYFSNYKAQAWMNLRRRVQLTHLRVSEGIACDDDEIISLPNDTSLLVEMSQAIYKLNTAGKVVIDKAPGNAKSPNKTDAVVMWAAANIIRPMRVADF